MTPCSQWPIALNASFCLQGSARAVVTRTGVNTIMGKMTELTAANPKEETLITK